MAHVSPSSELKIALAELIRQSERLRARSRELRIARVAAHACYRKQVARSRKLCAPNSVGGGSNPVPCAGRLRLTN
jgi:hypothetical protein